MGIISQTCENMVDWILDRIPVLVIGVCLIVFFVVSGIIYLGYEDYKSPTFTLSKVNWECTKSHESHNTSYIMVGNGMLPMTDDEQVCDEYKKK